MQMLARKSGLIWRRCRHGLRLAGTCSHCSQVSYSSAVVVRRRGTEAPKRQAFNNHSTLVETGREYFSFAIRCGNQSYFQSILDCALRAH